MARLLEHPDSTTFEITALVRSAAKAAKLETLGLKTVIGSYSDLDQLELLTSEADVVFSIVNNSKLVSYNYCLIASFLSSIPGWLRWFGCNQSQIERNEEKARGYGLHPYPYSHCRTLFWTVRHTPLKYDIPLFASNVVRRWWMFSPSCVWEP